MNHKAIMKQALDALEYNLGSLMAGVTYDKTEQAIEALRAAIAQGESEPIDESIDHRFNLTEMILQDVCELDPDDPAMNDTICIDISVLKRVIDSRFSECITKSKNMEDALSDLRDESRYQSEVVKQMISERSTTADMLTKWQAGKVCAQDAMVLLSRVYSSNSHLTKPESEPVREQICARRAAKDAP